MKIIKTDNIKKAQTDYFNENLKCKGAFYKTYGMIEKYTELANGDPNVTKETLLKMLNNIFEQVKIEEEKLKGQ